MTECKKCQAKINFIRMKSGKWMPVDLESVHGSDLDDNDTLITEDGRTIRTRIGYTDNEFGFVPHWKTCSESDHFRRKDEKTSDCASDFNRMPSSTTPSKN